MSPIVLSLKQRIESSKALFKAFDSLARNPEIEKSEDEKAQIDYEMGHEWQRFLDADTALNNRIEHLCRENGFSLRAAA